MSVQYIMRRVSTHELCSFESNNYLCTRQKQKRTTTIFPFRSPFNTKILIVMKDSFLIIFLIKRECDVDEYLHLPFVCTKHIKTSVSGSVNSTLLSTWNSEYVFHFQSMKTKRCRYVRQPMCLLMHFCYSKINFHHLGLFQSIIYNVEIFKCFVRFISSML